MLQAALLCDNLKMRIDTESKVVKQVGQTIRGPGSPYNMDCLAGLNKAFEEEENGLCESAWKDFGCSGAKIPRLIQENPFRLENVILCEY